MGWGANQKLGIGRQCRRIFASGRGASGRKGASRNCEGRQNSSTKKQRFTGGNKKKEDDYVGGKTEWDKERSLRVAGQLPEGKSVGKRRTAGRVGDFGVRGNQCGWKKATGYKKDQPNRHPIKSQRRGKGGEGVKPSPAFRRGVPFNGAKSKDLERRRWG